MSDLAPSTFLTKIIDCIKSEEEGGFENIFHILTDPTSKVSTIIIMSTFTLHPF